MITAGERGSREAAPRAERGVDPRRERGHRRRLEHRLERDLHLERAGDPRLDLGGEERVPAQLEEVGRRRDVGDLEHLGEDPRERFLHRPARRDVSALFVGAELRERAARGDRSCRSPSAAARRAARTPRAPCAREPLLQRAPQLARRQRGARDRREIRDDPLVTRHVLARHDDDLAHRGCSASAASISPSSIRKPRSFT